MGTSIHSGNTEEIRSGRRQFVRLDLLHKPSPKVYVETVEIRGLDPTEVCMVAAHNGDLAAARACGLKTAFVLRPTERGPTQTSDLLAEQPWDFTARDLNDLTTQLSSTVRRALTFLRPESCKAARTQHRKRSAIHNVLAPQARYLRATVRVLWRRFLVAEADRPRRPTPLGGPTAARVTGSQPQK